MQPNIVDHEGEESGERKKRSIQNRFGCEAIPGRSDLSLFRGLKKLNRSLMFVFLKTKTRKYRWQSKNQSRQKSHIYKSK